MFKKFIVSSTFALAIFSGVGVSENISNVFTVEASASEKVSTKYVNVPAGSLNVRQSHSPSAKKLTALKTGTQVQVLKTVTNKNGSKWASVVSGKTKGWVNTKYLTNNGPKSTAQAKQPTTHTASKSNVISIGKQLIGIKYKWGGTSTRGFDCSGFTQYVFKKSGKHIPRTAAEQHRKSKSISHSQAKPGDLVFFAGSGKGKVTHVAIYAGNGQLLHSTSSRGITLGKLNDGYWNKRIIGYGRI